MHGHTVYTPTLTGLGERSHLLNSNITLETHITDVVNVFKWEDIEAAVLCGHSYGGWVISGVAEQVLSHVSAIVYLDAYLPEDGQTGEDLTSASSRAAIAAARAAGEISRPAPPAKFFGVNPNDRAWVDEKMTWQPIGVSTQPIKLTGARESVPTKVYIRALDFKSHAFDRFLLGVQANPSWRTYQLRCGHDVMIDMPGRLGEILLEVAS